MSDRKSFTIALTEDEPARPPLEFDLSDEKGRVTEVFNCRPWLLNEPMLMKAANMSIDANSVAFFKIFEMAMGDPDAMPEGVDDPTEAQIAAAQRAAGDYPRFEAFVQNPKIKVSAQVLSNIIDWMWEEATGHPRKPSTSSSRGSRRTSRS